MMNKKDLSERDICTKFITPALAQAGWDLLSQVREEVAFTRGRIIVRGKLVARGKAKRADYILYYKPNIPIALIEAKDNQHSVGDGMQQGLEYATSLDIPFVFSSNGDAFLFHDRPVRVQTLKRNCRSPDSRGPMISGPSTALGKEWMLARNKSFFSPTTMTAARSLATTSA
jgi:type I site-specific restriction endonuclease